MEETGKELVDVAMGTEGKFELDIVGGKLVMQVTYDGVQVDASAKVSAEIDMFIDKLAEKIPGQIDDAIFGVLKGALKMLG